MKTYTLILILTLGTIFFFFKDNSLKKEEIKIETIKTVEVQKLKKEVFSKKLKLRGFTEASRIVTLKAQVEGKISSKKFTKGSFYKAETQLLLIDPEDKIAKVKEMEALLDQRKKEYEVAENLLDSYGL